MKNNMTFREQYEYRARIRKINENSWFGIISGTILSVVFGYQSLCVVGMISVLFNVFAAFGLIVVILGAFFPTVLSKPVKIVRKARELLGNVILKIMLIPVYLLMSLVNAFIHKSYCKKFGFDRWKSVEKNESSFYDYNQLERKNGRFVTFDIINSILDFFVVNKTFIVIPIVVLLLIFGMIIFFASSNAVFSFVYTLF